MTVGSDASGLWASVGCDKRGCYRHVAARPAGHRRVPAYDLICQVFDWAAEDGWELDGRAWCPEHARRRQRLGRVGEGYDWLRVRRRKGSGQQGLS
jgi:hypothetical protein